MKLPLLFALLACTLQPVFAAAIPVRVATVEQTAHAAERQIPGRIEAIHTVELRARTEGAIAKIHFRDGQYVKKGDLLFELDDAEPRAALRLAQAEVRSAEATLRQAQQQLSRFESLGSSNAISRHDVDNARMQRDVASAALEQAKARLETRNVTLNYTRITSPIDGVVISRAVEEGQTVAAGFETPTLFTIANDLTQMQVVADVDEADIGQVADGQRVQFSVDAYPDDTFEGTVLQVRLEATTESNVVTYEVVIDAPNPDLKLKPGLTANVTIFTLEKDDATAVPTKALRFVPNAELLGELGLTIDQTEQQAAPGSRELWVKEGTTLRPRRVYAGAASGDMTEITEGLTGSEEIVTGLVTAKPREETAAIERSPFMPGPPGSNDKKK